MSSAQQLNCAHFQAKTLEEELLLVKEELFQVKLSLHNLPQTTTEETYTSIPGLFAQLVHCGLHN